MATDRDASLLEERLARQSPRLFGDRLRRSGGILGDSPTPAPDPAPPTVNVPSIGPPQITRPSFQAPGLPEPPQVDPSELRRAFRGGVAQQVASVAGQVPPEAQDWINETARLMADPKSGEGQPGFGGFLDRLLGSNVPGLTQRQMKRLRNQSLMNFGLSLMGSSAVGAPLGFALAEGLLGARQIATEEAGALLAEQEAQGIAKRYYDALNAEDLTELQKWKAVQQQALLNGESPDTLRAINDVVETLGEQGNGVAERKFQTLKDGTPVFVDEAVGRIFDIQGNEITEVDPADPDTMAAANTLRDDYERALGREAQDIALSFGKIQALPETAAGDVGLVFSIMKMFDPTSAVREGEQATARNAAGVPARVRNLWNNLLTGENLTPDQRADFRNTARRIAQQTRSQLAPVITRYSEIAQRNGVDPRDVVYDPFAVVLDSIQSGSGGAEEEGEAPDPPPSVDLDSIDSDLQGYLEDDEE